VLAACGPGFVTGTDQYTSPLLPYRDMTIVSATVSPETANLLVDGDRDTAWEALTLPAEVVIDLGKTYDVNTWAHSSYHGWTSVGPYQLYTANELGAWEAAAAAGEATEADFTVRFSARRARYVKLVFLGARNGDAYAY